MAAALKSGKVKHIVLISSIGTDQLLNPLNLFGGVLVWKKLAEEYLQRSGITYTIVRPGGLGDEPQAGARAGGIIIAGPDKLFQGRILRDQVTDR